MTWRDKLWTVLISGAIALAMFVIGLGLSAWIYYEVVL